MTFSSCRADLFSACSLFSDGERLVNSLDFIVRCSLRVALCSGVISIAGLLQAVFSLRVQAEGV